MSQPNEENAVVLFADQQQSQMAAVAGMNAKDNVFIPARRLRAIGETLPDAVPDERFVQVRVARIRKLCEASE